MVLVNNTKRVIFAGELMLVPGKAKQVKDIKKLTASNPRLAEMLENGEITSKAAEEVKATESKNMDTKTNDAEDDSGTLNRRKRG